MRHPGAFPVPQPAAAPHGLALPATRLSLPR
jgi:hypothetical protein